jgi:hypothetical protein
VCLRHFQACCPLSETCCRGYQVLPGVPKVHSGAMRYSQTYLNDFHSILAPVIIDPSHSHDRPECPCRVEYSPEIDASMFALPIVSVTPGRFQWLNSILPMLYVNIQAFVVTTWYRIDVSFRICGIPQIWNHENDSWVTSVHTKYDIDWLEMWISISGISAGRTHLFSWYSILSIDAAA